MPRHQLLNIGAILCGAGLLLLQAQQKVVWNANEAPIAEKIHNLRQVPDSERGRVTKLLALQIRALPVTSNKLLLATSLANLSTEGDFGRENLQEVATTLADALKEQPIAAKDGPPAQYVVLAQLVKYEHMQAALDAPEFRAAMEKLEADDKARRKADFSLRDLNGQLWTLQMLRGKVVLVNFWATWCPPCRKEMPDLDLLHGQFKEKGLVILAISDEDEGKVKPFLAEHGVHYPILLDPGRKVNDLFRVEGIPKSFVYDRAGKLVAQSIDMRTRKQFLEMLGEAGLR